MNLTIEKIMTGNSAIVRLHTTYWLLVARDVLKQHELTADQARRLDVIQNELERRGEA